MSNPNCRCSHEYGDHHLRAENWHPCSVPFCGCRDFVTISIIPPCPSCVSEFGKPDPLCPYCKGSGICPSESPLDKARREFREAAFIAIFVRQEYGPEAKNGMNVPPPVMEKYNALLAAERSVKPTEATNG